MYINTFQYKPEHIDCKLCDKYAAGKGCTADSCPWLAERIEAGVVGYEEAILETFPRNIHLDAKLHLAIRRFSGSLFLTAAHRQRMDDLKARRGKRSRRDTPAYFAAMYLLTVNRELYERTRGCFLPQGLQFEYANVSGISPHNYTLLSAARDIYSDSTKVSASDLARTDVVDTLAFSLIVNALLVARYGPAVLEISSAQSPLPPAAKTPFAPLPLLSPANPRRWASPGVKREAPPSAHHWA